MGLYVSKLFSDCFTDVGYVDDDYKETPYPYSYSEKNITPQADSSIPALFIPPPPDMDIDLELNLIKSPHVIIQMDAGSEAGGYDCNGQNNARCESPYSTINISDSVEKSEHASESDETFDYDVISCEEKNKSQTGESDNSFGDNSVSDNSVSDESFSDVVFV